MPPIDNLNNPDVLKGVIGILALGFLVAIAMAALYREDARYWRWKAAIWRTRTNAYRREAVAFRIPSQPREIDSLRNLPGDSR